MTPEQQQHVQSQDGMQESAFAQVWNSMRIATAGNDRALRVWPRVAESPPRVSLTSVSIVSATAMGPTASGGAISVDSSELKVADVAIRDCLAQRLTQRPPRTERQSRDGTDMVPAL